MTKELAQGGAGRVRGWRETLLLQGPPRRLYFLPPFGGGCRARQDPNRVEAGAVRGSLLRATSSQCARGISVGRQLLARRVETVAEYNVRGSRPPIVRNVLRGCRGFRDALNSIYKLRSGPKLKEKKLCRLYLPSCLPLTCSLS